MTTASVVGTNGAGDRELLHPVPRRASRSGLSLASWVQINDLQEAELPRLLHEFVPRVGADDLVFVFNDNVAAYAARSWLAALHLEDEAN